jgi:hypothetical protein
MVEVCQVEIARFGLQTLAQGDFSNTVQPASQPASSEEKFGKEKKRERKKVEKKN